MIPDKYLYNKIKDWRLKFDKKVMITTGYNKVKWLENLKCLKGILFYIRDNKIYKKHTNFY